MTLSGGEKQRVVIASALAQAPRRAAARRADGVARSRLPARGRRRCCTRLNRERGVTMVLATHDLNLAASLCDRLVLMRDGRVLAQGPTREVLTAATIRAALRRRCRRELPRARRPRDGDAGEARCNEHASTPRRGTDRGQRPRRTLADDPRRSASDSLDASPASARWRSSTCLLAPLVGSTPISLARVVRSLDPVRRQRRRADLLRRADAARARRRAGRRRAGGRRRRLSGAAAQSAGDAVHARRLRRRVARRDARHHLRRVADAPGRSRRAAGQPRRRGRRRRHRLPAGDDAGPRDVDDGAAARRRDAELVLLGADHVRAVHRRLRAGLSRRALADGRPRRRQLRADRRRAAAAGRSPSRCSRCCPRR